MHLLPVTQFSLRVQRTPDELQGQLASHIEPPSPIAYLRQHREFTGKVDSRGFEVRRIGYARSSFRPHAYGQFSPAPQGSLVSVVIKLPPLFLPTVVVFATIFGALGFQSLTGLLSSALRGELVQALSFPAVCGNAFFIVSPLAVLIMSIALAWLFFRPEAAALQNSLSVIFASGEVP